MTPEERKREKFVAGFMGAVRTDRNPLIAGMEAMQAPDMPPTVAWLPRPGGEVANIPKELGGGMAYITPRAFGSKFTRLRVHDNPHTPHFFLRQFYASPAKAKAALMAKLGGGQ